MNYNNFGFIMVLVVISTIMIAFGFHNIDNAVNMLNVEKITGIGLLDCTALNTEQCDGPQHVYSMGFLLVFGGMVMFIITVLITIGLWQHEREKLLEVIKYVKRLEMDNNSD